MWEIPEDNNNTGEDNPDAEFEAAAEDAMLDAQIAWCLEEIAKIGTFGVPHLFKDGVWQRWFYTKTSYAKELERYTSELIENPQKHTPIRTDYQAGQGSWKGKGFDPEGGGKTPTGEIISQTARQYINGGTHSRSWSWTKPRLPLTPLIPAPSGVSGAEHFIM